MSVRYIKQNHLILSLLVNSGFYAVQPSLQYGTISEKVTPQDAHIQNIRVSLADQLPVSSSSPGLSDSDEDLIPLSPPENDNADETNEKVFITTIENFKKGNKGMVLIYMYINLVFEK